MRTSDSSLNQPFKPTALLVIYGALANACLVSIALCAVFGLAIKLDIQLPPDAAALLKVLFLGLGVTQLVAGVATATVNLSPAGWERHPLEGWQPAPQRLKGNDLPDTADRFGQRALQRIVLGSALIEAVALYGLVQVIVGNGLAVGIGMGAVAFLAMLSLLPRVLYVKNTVEELRRIEAAGEGASEEE